MQRKFERLAADEGDRFTLRNEEDSSGSDGSERRSTGKRERRKGGRREKQNRTLSPMH